MQSPIQLVVLDMAGTTVKDLHEVEKCFKEAAVLNGLFATDDRVLALQGYAKLLVFEMLWEEQLGQGHPDIKNKALNAYESFKNILENHYKSNEVYPTEGCEPLFNYLHKQGIYIALTTGFYRTVANIILDKLGWLDSLNLNYTNLSNKKGIHISVTPDEVEAGRPSPKMIEHAMKIVGIKNPNLVINIGDTPVDLAFGKNANVRLALGVCNGTHTKGQLAQYPNDGLLNNVAELIEIIEYLNNEKI